MPKEYLLPQTGAESEVPLTQEQITAQAANIDMSNEIAARRAEAEVQSASSKVSKDWTYANSEDGKIEIAAEAKFKAEQAAEQAKFAAEKKARDDAKAAHDKEKAILCVRGAFYRVQLADKNDPGMYALQGLTIPQSWKGWAGTTETICMGAPILINGIKISQTDIYGQVPCLENVKVFYTFGQNFGQVAIAGEMLLGPMGETNMIGGGGLKQLTDWFNEMRVSKKKKPIKVSVLKEAYYVYLTGMDLLPVDANVHIMPFVLYGILIDLSREDFAKVNPNATIITEGGAGGSLTSALSVRLADAPLGGLTSVSGSSSNATPPAVGSSGPGQPISAATASTTTAGPMPNANAIVTAALAEQKSTGKALTTVQKNFVDQQNIALSNGGGPLSKNYLNAREAVVKEQNALPITAPTAPTAQSVNDIGHSLYADPYKSSTTGIIR